MRCARIIRGLAVLGGRSRARPCATEFDPVAVLASPSEHPYLLRPRSPTTGLSSLGGCPAPSSRRGCVAASSRAPDPDPRMPSSTSAPSRATRRVVITHALRTPIGRYLGAFADLSAADLGASVVKSVLGR